ncbi:ribonuclease HI [candidate division KSB1 bacterium]|nr:ribonuclease HI [candidate division KSB1 bacterium]NIR69544.1 ribonuclease HI [candidate division KSB1 bacterium]NIS22854.1 ribonuclease HI [candidate division KSB1 bacterium]NIT69691.1 ribonuclease HI [candidate division KSB1 bacterium]NIU23360.1 ribonuclease HI [candidate division KSB1 bacterium]
MAETTVLRHLTIYTDGACHGNPGPGGYAAVLIHQGKRKEISGGFNNTTNNRMELMAAIKGLEALKERCQVTLYSDSEYLVNAMTLGWVESWQAKGWKRNKKEKAKNVDLWKQLLKLIEYHEVEFKWTRGHVGTLENERCDVLANQAANQPNLPDDPINQSSDQSEMF